MREKTLNKTRVGELLFPDESYALMGAAFEVYSDIEVAQTLNYLKVTGLSLALILNFSAHDKLEWKRVVLSGA